MAGAPRSSASRVDLAAAVGMTPSGVTRALRPLEKLHIVETVRAERDARLALARLTDAGREIVEDASRIIDDVVRSVLGNGEKQASVSDLVEQLV